MLYGLELNDIINTYNVNSYRYFFKFLFDNKELNFDNLLKIARTHP